MNTVCASVEKIDRIEFFDLINQYPFLKVLEERYEEILKELLSIQSGQYTPWPQFELYENKEGWKVFGLKAFSQKIESNCNLCPITTSILESITNEHGYEISTAGFSRLAPNVHIKPHAGYEGYSEKIIRVHLGLIIPNNPDLCVLKVGSSMKSWERGKLLGFNDLNVHEAWNRSSEVRTVLLFDMSREKSKTVIAPKLCENVSEQLKKLME